MQYLVYIYKLLPFIGIGVLIVWVGYAWDCWRGREKKHKQAPTQPLDTVKQNAAVDKMGDEVRKLGDNFVEASNSMDGVSKALIEFGKISKSNKVSGTMKSRDKDEK